MIDGIAGGFGVGCMTSTVSEWSSDTVSARLRGRLFSVQGFKSLVCVQASSDRVKVNGQTLRLA